MKDITPEINQLPCEPGVYFFYDYTDRLVYVGKSINIRSRVKQHFSGKDRKSLKIQQTVKRIDHEVMGSELIALLYESELIKTHQPLYNRAQRRSIYQYGLYLTDVNGYKALRIAKTEPEKEEITSFSSVREAKEVLHRITEKYGLCQKINGLYKTSSYCFGFHIKVCNGACMAQEPAELYNARVDAFLNKSSFEKFTRLFEVAGRTGDEKGLVYIENGVYKGFGFCPADTPQKRLLSFISARQDNRDVRRILMRYLVNS